MSRMVLAPEEKGQLSQPSCGSIQRIVRIKPRRIGGESRWRGAIMPGHLQEGFGCVVTNRFDQLLDDESDPFEILKAAEAKKKEGAAAGSTKTAAQAAKQPKKESQKDRKNPLLDKKEESQAPVPQKKEGNVLTRSLGCVQCMFIFSPFSLQLSCAAPVS